MKKILTYLFTSIVDHPDQIKIETTGGTTGETDFDIRVAKEDMGRVIGKNGSVIKAVRLVASISKTDKNLRLNLIETD